jgi:hypothetical protein|tara:strand:- start:367 stop:606 length:240 start_codon:yes stop_codon:yes gene_type:complete
MKIEKELKLMKSEKERQQELMELAGDVFTSHQNAHGDTYYRAYFRSGHELEDFFIEYFLGTSGWSSKIIGTAMLFWRRK